MFSGPPFASLHGVNSPTVAKARPLSEVREEFVHGWLSQARKSHLQHTPPYPRSFKSLNL